MTRLLIGILGLLVLGGPGVAWAGERVPEPFSGEARDLVDEFRALKTQSLTLLEVIKTLQYERQQLLEEVKALQKERLANQRLTQRVRALSAALERARQSLATLRKTHTAALARTEELEQVQLDALTREMQGLEQGSE